MAESRSLTSANALPVPDQRDGIQADQTGGWSSLLIARSRTGINEQPTRSGAHQVAARAVEGHERGVLPEQADNLVRGPGPGGVSALILEEVLHPGRGRRI